MGRPDSNDAGRLDHCRRCSCDGAAEAISTLHACLVEGVKLLVVVRSVAYVILIRGLDSVVMKISR